MNGATRSVDLDAVNRSRWSSARIAAEFERTGSRAALECWTDPGERAALTSVAALARGHPILDIGVGGGRTTTLLRLLSSDYLGIDYLPEMVLACRRNHPDADIRLGDVRTLSGVEDERFGLVVFSNNGLDAIDHEDRQRALLEIHRTLAANGLLVFSTHNKSGPCYGATPWRPAGSPTAHSWSRLYRFARAMHGAARAPIALPRALSRWRRLAGLAVDADEWGIGPVEAHDFGLLIHFTTLAGAMRELNAAGLMTLRAYDAEFGASLDLDSDPNRARYFHLVAQKSPLT